MPFKFQDTYDFFQDKFAYLEDLKVAKTEEYQHLVQSSAALEQSLAQNDDVTAYLLEELRQLRAKRNASKNDTECTKIHSFSFLDLSHWLVLKFLTCG